ncbi:MAG TPA: hypothetical protein VFI77_09365 [Gemmatimonadales bacterium]|nr:hypothetical protein [Gemmatimonadales bacterium]
MRWPVLAAVAVALVGSSCRLGAGSAPPLRVVSEHSTGITTFTLLAAPGIRISARVKPALELPDGTVLRFDSPHQTPDSSYFTRPPTLSLPGEQRRAEGTLRASVCEADELVCRSVVLRL